MAMIPIELEGGNTRQQYSSNTSSLVYNFYIYRYGKLRILVGDASLVPTGTDITLDSKDIPRIDSGTYGVTSYFLDATNSSLRLINVADKIHFWNNIANASYINLTYLAESV